MLLCVYVLVEYDGFVVFLKGLDYYDGSFLFHPYYFLFFLHVDFHTETRSARVGF